MQRWIQQAHGHRQAIHDPEQGQHVLFLKGQQALQVALPLFLVFSEDHAAHLVNALCVEEHVLGAAQADAFGAQFACLGGILWRFGIGAHLQATVLIGPGEQDLEVLATARFGFRHIA